MGRCMGVKRAMDLALKAVGAEDPDFSGSGSGTGSGIGDSKSLSQGSLTEPGTPRTRKNTEQFPAPTPSTGRAWTLGPLIHNPQAIADLERRGLQVLDEKDPGQVQAQDLVVIRAHGAPPSLVNQLKDSGAQIIDATCPRVLASQKKARQFHERGFAVIIAGDRNHGEVTGILGHAPGATVVSSPDEAARAAGTARGRPTALIAQTTIRREEYEAIKAAVAQASPGAEVVDSICPATEDRQWALVELASKVQAIVVVGGRDSANTRRLHLEARRLGLPSWHIETAAELDPGLSHFDTVGLTAGASTPDELVDEVERALLELDRSL